MPSKEYEDFQLELAVERAKVQTNGAKHQGYLFHRVASHDETRSPNYEKGMHEQWIHENSISYRPNGILEVLFEHTGNTRKTRFFGPHPVIQVRKRDKWIAATIIQWLGTNCGRSFLHQAFRRVGYEMTLTKID